MERITLAHLQAIVDRINRETGAPMEPYTIGADGKHHANIGNYHISRAYGGTCLHRMVNDGGGVSDVFGCGHVPARDLANRMHAYLAGIDRERRYG
jgi:hypothetical protein